MKIVLLVVLGTFGALGGFFLWKARGAPIRVPPASIDPGGAPIAPSVARASARSRTVPAPPVQPLQPPRPATTRELSEREACQLAERGAPRSPFVTDPSDRFAYIAVQATDEERRLANQASDEAQKEIDQAVELSHGTIDKSESVARIQQAYAARDRALDRIFGEDRAALLREIHLVEGVEVPDDSDPE